MGNWKVSPKSLPSRFPSREPVTPITCSLFCFYDVLFVCFYQDGLGYVPYNQGFFKGLFPSIKKISRMVQEKAGQGSKIIWIIVGAVAIILIAVVLIFLAVGTATVFGSNGGSPPSAVTSASGSHTVTTATCYGKNIIVSYWGGQNLPPPATISVRVDSMEPRLLKPETGSQITITPEGKGLSVGAGHMVEVFTTNTGGIVTMDLNTLIKCP